MKNIGRIKVVKSHNDIMQCICICPHCGREAIYGEMFTIFGIHGCPKCQNELNGTINFDKTNQYEVYIRKANNHEYEPYKFSDK